jgi:hypothetical protein
MREGGLCKVIIYILWKPEHAKGLNKQTPTTEELAYDTLSRQFAELTHMSIAELSLSRESQKTLVDRPQSHDCRVETSERVW